jgi:integrase
MVERRKGRWSAGDGSVYKAPDGRWRGAVDLGWVDEKRLRKYVSDATQAQAVEKLR